MLPLLHMIEQLDLAVLFWRNLGLSAECQSFPDDADDVARGERLLEIAKFAGYRLCVEVDAWKLAYSEGPNNPEGLLQFLTGFETLREIAANARMSVWKPEEMAAHLKQIGKKDVEVPSVERSARKRARIDSAAPKVVESLACCVFSAYAKPILDPTAPHGSARTLRLRFGGRADDRVSGEFDSLEHR